MADIDTIHVCQGPPRCDLTGDDAVKAIEAGCPFCKRIKIDRETGEEWVIEPGNDTQPSHLEDSNED